MRRSIVAIAAAFGLVTPQQVAAETAGVLACGDGIFLRNVTNVVLGQLDLRLSGGLGVRIDNRGDTSVRSRNIRIDNVYVSAPARTGWRPTAWTV